MYPAPSAQLSAFADAPLEVEKGSSLWQDAWSRLRKNRLAVAGGIIVLTLVLLCGIGPIFSQSYYEQDLDLGATPPSAKHWLGTDTSGRDLFARLLYGGRISMTVGLVATLVALCIGVTYGAVAGFYGGKLDSVMMRIVDILYSMPFVIFVILLMVFFGRNIILVFLAIGAVEWLTMARIVRGQIISIKKMEYIEAARSLGLSQRRIIFRHMIPNVLGPIIVYCTLTIPAVMLLEAFLSFLGLGVQPPMSSWGVLIKDGADKMEEFWWLLVFPAGVFSLTLFSLNFLGMVCATPWTFALRKTSRRAERRRHFAMNRFLPYLKYLRGRRTALVLALICGAISGAVYGFGMPKVINDIFPEIFTDSSGAATPAVSLGKFSLNSSGTKPDSMEAKTRETERIRASRTLSRWQVARYALLIPLIFLVRAGAGFLNNYLMNYCGIGVLEGLRVELYRKLQYLPLSYFGQNRTGDLLSRLTADTQMVQQTITTSASDLVIQPVTLLSAVYFLGWTAWKNHGAGLFLASLGVVPLCVFPVRFIGKKLLRRAEENQRLLGDISDLTSQNLAAAREVRAFGLEEKEVIHFQTTTRRLFTSQMKVVKYSQLLSPLIEIIASLGIALSLYYAYYAGISLAVFVAILGALFVCYEPMKKLGNLHAQFARGGASLSRLEEILQAPVTITDPPQPVPAFRIQGDVAFENVGFAYREGEPVLDHINVRIPAGTVCALVGPSGAGKSTFANLIPRFYDVTSGTVKLDGHDLRSMRVADLRRAIAIVSQEPVLFNDTILANLRLGRVDASCAEIEAAARDAYAHDFIISLPRGYETMVGERGASLSGGQRQRLALARAFLRNAPILILDEATSALDGASEAEIQLALKKLVVGKTVFIIAHRFSTIRDASLILVFDEGALVATGTHQDLHTNNSLYRSLYNRQQLTAVEAPGVV